MTILAIVNASSEGQIESKIMKSRQMEEIREARRKQAELKQEQRMSKLVSSYISSLRQTANFIFEGGDQKLPAPKKETENRPHNNTRTSRGQGFDHPEN